MPSWGISACSVQDEFGGWAHPSGYQAPPCPSRHSHCCEGHALGAVGGWLMRSATCTVGAKYASSQAEWLVLSVQAKRRFGVQPAALDLGFVAIVSLCRA